MDAREFSAAVDKLGFSGKELGELWGMGEGAGRTIRRWKSGESKVNPLAAYSIQLMLEHEATLRPRGFQAMPFKSVTTA